MQDSDSERLVRERAYSIWEEQGRPEGQHESHWDLALKELGLKSAAETAVPMSGVADNVMAEADGKAGSRSRQ